MTLTWDDTEYFQEMLDRTNQELTQRFRDLGFDIVDGPVQEGDSDYTWEVARDDEFYEIKIGFTPNDTSAEIFGPWDLSDHVHDLRGDPGRGPGPLPQGRSAGSISVVPHDVDTFLDYLADVVTKKGASSTHPPGLLDKVNRDRARRGARPLAEGEWTTADLEEFAAHVRNPAMEQLKRRLMR